MQSTDAPSYFNPPPTLSPTEAREYRRALLRRARSDIHVARLLLAEFERKARVEREQRRSRRHG